VVIELGSDVRFARDLAAGGVFVPGCTLRLAQECDLLVCGANHRLTLPARVVYVDAQRGAGLELIGFSPELKARLAELEPMVRPSFATLDAPVVEESAADDGPLDATPPEHDHEPRGFTEPVPLVVLEAFDDDLALVLDLGGDAGDTDAYPQFRDDDTAGMDRTGASHDTEAHPVVANTAPGGYDDTFDPEATLGEDEPDRSEPQGDDDPEATLNEADGDATASAAGGPSQRDSGRPFSRNVHERLRGLNLAAQIKLAVSGELHERIVLERLYGKNVWETLLRNPRLTAPEVSRIARYGALPRVLLEIIVGNNAWLQIPEVRRALLSNPRLATDQVVKVLRLTPKHELRLATVQTAYPAAVRNAAKMLLRDSHGS
jgi:hypothetical protein